MPPTRGTALLLALGALLPAGGLGADRPIAARKLVLKRAATGAEKLVFVSRDPTFLFPAVGGGDDPATGTPGGAQVTLVTQAGESVTLAAPAGADAWRVKPAAFKFSDREADGPLDLRVVVLKEGSVLKVVARSTGLALGAPLGAVGVRVTTGELRSCARFDAATVRRDETGTFLAKGALAAALSDCSDSSLAGSPLCGDATFPECGGGCPEGAVCTSQDLVTCTCVAASDPCGDTAPVCNGTCPMGEECVSVGPAAPFNRCACSPAGVTLCGASGFPTCGGECPVGSPGCGAFTSPTFGSYCACGDCETSGPCPFGTTCVPQAGGCIPIFCTGGDAYPLCGGSCPAGLECGAVQFSDAAFAGCLCGPPGSCDAGCGSYACDPGEVCVVDTALTSCGCE